MSKKQVGHRSIFYDVSHLTAKALDDRPITGSMAVLCLAMLTLGVISRSADAQINEWTWMGGSGTVPSAGSGWPGTYGTLGTPAVGNLPGGRGSASTWTDNQWLV
jgi:hypothetical protein